MNQAINYQAIKEAMSTPNEWTIVPTYPNSEYPETKAKMSLKSNDGTELAFDIDKGRIEVRHVRPSRPHTLDGGQYVEVYNNDYQKLSAGTIGFSATKSPAQIAKDVEKRILPMATTITSLVQIKIKAEETEHAARIETLQAIAKAANQEVRFHGSMKREETPEGKAVHTFVPDLNKPHYNFSVMPSPCKGYIHEVSVQGSNSIDLKFSSLSKEQAFQLLEFVTSSKLLILNK